ncbi:TVP38/TMEM64 family protein [Paenibacillus allorhizosphaerae]|uniref:TVP38/TMEM64 family membrane protein n=1 Tax=Paenibacillus allorhizosphaerae TaxID=2849866 RepID=A0ABM8VFS3_9BACL|nr:TVP38/TMEM64 family protein [Paenibacillus allorhizosphaerae]CAG7635914.1 hypothetical protein PAECIP111802_02195 [Paenibacillus allorhizosphaerae]
MTSLLSRLSWEDIENWLQHYESLGPIPGVAAAMVESFIPVLPLVAIIVANVNAYGPIIGALLSWLGIVFGAVSVFLLARKFGSRLRGWIERKYPGSRKLIHWVETHGFTPIFVLSCFPFTPSSLVNVVSGISRLPLHTFVTATMLGKAVMVGIVAVAGYDLEGLFRKPWKAVAVIVVLAVIWLIGRKLESRYMKQ